MIGATGGMRHDRTTRTQESGPILEKADRFPGHGTSKGYHRYPTLWQIQPTEADDSAFAGNWHRAGTDCGDEL